jgi:hypothetical protein
VPVIGGHRFDARLIVKMWMVILEEKDGDQAFFISEISET